LAYLRPCGGGLLRRLQHFLRAYETLQIVCLRPECGFVSAKKKTADAARHISVGIDGREVALVIKEVVFAGVERNRLSRRYDQQCPWRDGQP
jgi:hypothetical protein